MRRLLADLCDGLEAGEDKPTTPLARKAFRLAGMLHMRPYQLLFQFHLEGVQKDRPPDPETTTENVADEAFARLLFTRDRTMSTGMVQGHQLHLLEELHARICEVRDLGRPDANDSEFELRQILQRIRSRIGRFVLDAEKCILEQEQKDPYEKSSRTEVQKVAPMTLQADASLVLRAVAEFEVEPGDERRGRHNVTQHGLEQALASTWDTPMTPERINDAVQVLEDSGYVKLRRGPGTSPYRFSGIEVSPQGRLVYERETARLQTLSQKPAERSLSGRGTKIFFGHGGTPVWKDFRDYVRDRLHLEWDEFNREATAGVSTQARLEQMLDDAAFALLIMTAEDELADGTKMARANVIHEIGLFQGRLGFKRAIVLLENGCEPFSNIHGLTQIRFDRSNASAKFDEIRHTLEREGLVK